MKDKYILTAESVTAGHPDKLCDTIADNVLDACLKEDPNARVACEVLATAGKILVAGELRTTASPDVEAIVRQTVRNAGYDCNYHVEVRLHTQSPDIAGAVDGDTLGAGDQGIMYGYACWETVELLPAPIVLANRITSLLTTCREEKLISGIGPDGKAQVSVQYAFGVPERVDTIVISCQHDADKDPDELREELRRLVIARACHDVRIDENTKIFINPSGRFVLGGFEADTGLTGRKLMVDTYGGLAPHGGGALSGKDGTVRFPARTAQRLTAAAHIWRDIWQRTLSLRVLPMCVRSALPMPLGRQSRLPSKSTRRRADTMTTHS